MLRSMMKSAVTPIARSYYNMNRTGTNPTVLKLLGIANESWREDFATLQRLVHEIRDIDGAIAECGVFRGGTLLGMAHLLRQDGQSRHLFGLDSFEGLPEPTNEDSLGDGSFHQKALAGTFNNTSLEELQGKVQQFGFAEQISLIKGFFEDTLHNLDGHRFALVHIDCDLYQPYKDCLEFFYDRVNPGGYLVFDEYDYSAPVYPGAQKAIDTFFADKPETVDCFEGLKHPRYFARKK